MKGLVTHVISDFYIDLTVCIGLSAFTAKSRMINVTNNTFIAAQMDFFRLGVFVSSFESVRIYTLVQLLC